MNRIDPPQLPTWMMRHLKAPGSNEALDGDLLEEFNSGRSRTWYCCQVFAGLAIGWLEEVRRHRNLAVFAVLWSFLAPGWNLMAMRIAEEKAAAWHIWQLDWPLSILCSTTLFFVPGLVFIWIGLAISVMVRIRNVRAFDLRRLGLILLFTVPVFIGISAVFAGIAVVSQPLGQNENRNSTTLSIAPAAPLIALKPVGGGRDVIVIRDKHGVAKVQATTRVYLEPNSPWEPKPFQLERHAVDENDSHPWAAITQTGVWPIVNRLPFFLSLLFMLWAAERATCGIKKTTL